MFAVAPGTTISCSMGRWYGPVLSLSFLVVHLDDKKRLRDIAIYFSEMLSEICRFQLRGLVIPISNVPNIYFQVNMEVRGKPSGLEI
jgi:hypothetical protein